LAVSVIWPVELATENAPALSEPDAMLYVRAWFSGSVAVTGLSPVGTSLEDGFSGAVIVYASLSNSGGSFTSRMFTTTVVVADMPPPSVTLIVSVYLGLLGLYLSTLFVYSCPEQAWMEKSPFGSPA